MRVTYVQYDAETISSSYSEFLLPYGEHICSRAKYSAFPACVTILKKALNHQRYLVF